MNTSNLKLIWRNLWKNANISAINIIGLSVSLAISALIALFLNFEGGFDKSNAAYGDMYRLVTTFKYPNSPERETALASPMMGSYLQRESGDIEAYLRVMTDIENFIGRANERETTIKKSLQVDTSFFTFFNYPLLFGDKKSVFDKPENIVIARQVSEALFGAENPVGKMFDYTFSLDAERDTTVHYMISGVLDDLPKNSHLQFDALTFLDDRQFEQQEMGNRWHGVNTNTYFRVRPSANADGKLAESFPKLLKKEMPNSDMVSLSLQPFSDIHLGSMALEYDHNNFQKSDRKYMKVLGLVAIFILLISSINFANLTTVLGMRRVQEVGVRKSLGATGANILGQFLGESMLMAMIGGGLAIVWVELLRKPFLSLVGKDVDMAYTPAMISWFIGAVILLGLLAGIYPAIQAARYSAVEAFKNSVTSLSVKRPFVQGLVVLQFVLSGMLIIGALVSHNQLKYMQNKDLGFNYAQVVEIDLGMGNGWKSTAIKKELAAVPGVMEASGSSASLGTLDGQNGLLVRNQETKQFENFPMATVRVAPNFFRLYDMKFVVGHAPTEESASKEMEFVVNQSFLEKVGLKGDPIGNEIMINGFEADKVGRIVGVIHDIHHNTLHHKIEPISFLASDFTPIISLKVNPANMQAVLKQFQAVWNEHIKDRPFEYKFVDERFAQLYESENRLGQILLVATILSILIACLGLLALSAFIIQQRTKEIGIRKVLGATTAGIVGLLSKDFLKLVILSMAFASPLAYFLMEKWLQDFAYHTNIAWWVFALTVAIGVSVAFVTVSFQGIKAALANPVNSLRSE
ncbi:MAG: ABC transporter permease [Saprospiraceae bacterium]|nr:ABC transporter permease [Saprospiraceae bacterium]MCF8248567.1 ABC transporter permease [Saprospiraceae bacterium]MCF8280266.1 ABC transporter permease [Bacteroidales bacterium]MCF8310300.1 ABC transporter permease [Saprospiraceae bacterium]MCF8439260.1 ABC transporter permease [Saprospiraceae bacterium]